MKNLLQQDKIFYKKLSSIAIPIALQGLLSFSLPLIDTIFLGILGQDEISAATLANSPFFAIIMITFGFQSGAGVIINQYWGKGDRKTISKVIGITFFTALSVSALAATLAFLFPLQIMKFFTPNETLQILAADYMRIVAIAYILNVFTVIYITAHRCMGNARIGVYITAIAMFLNVFFNYIFIFGKFGFSPMGVKGAALGTVVARFIELLIVILYACFNNFFRLDIKEALNPGKEITKDFFKYAGPVVINETLWGSGFALFPALFSRGGSAAVAAYTIATNVERIVTIFSRGIGDSAGVIVGAELGRDKFYKATSYTRTLLTLTVLINLCIGIMVLFLSPYIVSFFNIEKETAILASQILILFVIKMPFAAFNHATIVGILRCGGDSKAAMFIDVFSMWFVALFGIAITVFIIKPEYTIFIFVPLLLDDIFKTILTAYRVRTGVWIKNITR